VQQYTFISYKGYRWLLRTVLALTVCCGVYGIDTPLGGRNGGTVVGYSLGVLATIGIVWLMAYGVRKRSYSSALGTVEGWLAAHVWIGIGLLLLVPLHSGFSFGCNVHTLAYLLMVVTIVSGIWGSFYYATLSSKIASHRGGRKDSLLLEQIQSLSREVEKMCEGRSDQFLSLINTFDFVFKPRLVHLLKAVSFPPVDKGVAGKSFATLPDSEREDALRCVGLIDQKIGLAQGLVDQSRIKALLRVWLFVHVPASIGLCVAVAIHIFSVFFFR